MNPGSAAEIRVALVGLGHVARHQVAAIELTECIRLAAACDLNAERAALIEGPVPFFTSFDSLLSGGQFDIVLISAPNREHFPLAMQAIDAGLPVVLEKPATETRPQFEEVAEASAKKNVFLYCAMHAAFGVEVTWLARQLQTGALGLGELLGFEASFYDPYITDDELVSGAASLGGSWMDSGVNALSVLGQFLDLAEVRVSRSRMQAAGKLNCSEVEGLVELESSAIRGRIHASWLTGRNHKSTRLQFEHDEITLDHSQQKVLRGAETANREIYSYDGPLDRLTNHYVGVFNDVVGCYSTGRGNIDDAAQVHHVFFAADEAREES